MGKIETVTDDFFIVLVIFHGQTYAAFMFRIRIFFTSVDPTNRDPPWFSIFLIDIDVVKGVFQSFFAFLGVSCLENLEIELVLLPPHSHQLPQAWFQMIH